MFGHVLFAKTLEERSFGRKTPTEHHHHHHHIRQRPTCDRALPRRVSFGVTEMDYDAFSSLGWQAKKKSSPEGHRRSGMGKQSLNSSNVFSAETLITHRNCKGVVFRSSFCAELRLTNNTRERRWSLMGWLLCNRRSDLVRNSWTVLFV